MTAADLAAFLEAEAEAAFEWGVRDCWLLAADWALARTGRDPAAAWRGRYASALGAARIINRMGGPEAFAGSSLAACGWVRSASPRRGQVGLLPAAIETTHGVRRALVGGIALGGGWWATRNGPGGLVMGRAEPTVFWRPR